VPSPLDLIQIWY